MDYSITHNTQCPGCNGKPSKREVFPGVARCQGCGGIFTTRPIYLGESYRLVLPRMTTANVPPGETQYYDLMCLGSEGITRRHGWMDPATRLIVQVG